MDILSRYFTDSITPPSPHPLLPLPFQFVSNSPKKLSFIRKIAFRKKLKIKKIVSFYFFVCDFYFFYYSIMFLKWGFVYKVMFCLQSEVSFTKTKWGFLYKAKFYLQSKVFVYKVRFCSQSEVLVTKWGFVSKVRFCLQLEVLFTKRGFVYKVRFCLQSDVLFTNLGFFYKVKFVYKKRFCFQRLKGRNRAKIFIFVKYNFLFLNQVLGSWHFFSTFGILFSEFKSFFF